MGFEEAFKALGYSLSNVRLDWSAEKADGVCVTMWQPKLGRLSNGRTYYDGWEIWPELANTRNPAHGNTKLIAHLTSAVEKFNGRVDAIHLSGTPETGYGNATPWIRDGYRQITKFNPDTGLYRADVFLPNETPPTPLIIQRD